MWKTVFYINNTVYTETNTVTDAIYIELSTFLPHKKVAKNAIARTLY